MIEREVVVTNDSGLHARPASMLVKEAMQYPCSLWLVKDGIEADLKSIMSILSLAVVAGSTVIVRADGENEQEALEHIVKLVEKELTRD
jgi:phosphocarrier protein